MYFAESQNLFRSKSKFILPKVNVHFAQSRIFFNINFTNLLCHSQIFENIWQEIFQKFFQESAMPELDLVRNIFKILPCQSQILKKYLVRNIFKNQLCQSQIFKNIWREIFSNICCARGRFSKIFGRKYFQNYSVPKLISLKTLARNISKNLLCQSQRAFSHPITLHYSPQND